MLSVCCTLVCIIIGSVFNCELSGTTGEGVHMLLFDLGVHCCSSTASNRRELEQGV